MKKTIPIALVFSFIFAMTAQMPVLAEDTATTTSNLNPPIPMLTSFNSEETSSSSTAPVPMLISANPESGIASGTPRIEPRDGAPRPNNASSTLVIGKNLEKIPKPEYVKYFNEIRKIGNDLFGIRKPQAEIIKLSAGSATSTLATTQGTSTLQRIPSPAHISLFEKIVKIGQDLFGVKKNNSENKATTTPATASSTLERIASPEQIKLFDQIKKIGNDLFGLRKKSAYVLPTMTPNLVTCTSAAIDVKDAAISASLTSASSELSSAISARGACQKTALALSSDQQTALNACNKTFQDTQKKANDKARNSQKEIWTTYSNSLKTCAQTANVSEIRIEDGDRMSWNLLNK